MTPCTWSAVKHHDCLLSRGLQANNRYINLGGFLQASVWHYQLACLVQAMALRMYAHVCTLSACKKVQVMLITSHIVCPAAACAQQLSEPSPS